MCCPLSGGGGGSPSRSGSVCTAPPSVGRASWIVTLWPASTSSSAAARPDSPPPTTATFTLPASRDGVREKSHSRHAQVRISELPSKAGGTGRNAPGGKQISSRAARRPGVSPEDEAGADDADLRPRRQPRRPAEDVETRLLDPLQGRLVEVRERGHAPRAAAVEVRKQR